MIHPGLGEARPHAAPVGSRPRRRDPLLRQGRRDLFGREAIQAAGEVGIGDRVAHEGVAARQAEVSERGVGRIQHVQLQRLVMGDVADQLDPRPFPGWARPGEAVLDHPLREELALDAGAVLQPGGRRHPRQQGGVRGRRDRIDHAVGKGGVRFDPAGEGVAAALREREDGLRQLAPVRAEVVAGDNRQGSSAAGPPSRQPLHQPADRGTRRSSSAKVMGDVGIVQVEGAICAVGVARLGYGQRQHVGRRRGDGFEDRAGLRTRGEGAAQHADNAVGRIGAAQFERVKAVLRRQDGSDVGTPQRHAHDAPGAAGRLHRVLGEHRLVGAVEGAGSQVHDPAAERGGIVGRPANRARNAVQGA